MNRVALVSEATAEPTEPQPCAVIELCLKEISKGIRTEAL